MKKLMLILILFLAPLVQAYEPVVVKETPVKIQEPKFSKMYFGNLGGQPEYYNIQQNKSFVLYMQLMSPYPEGKRTFNVSIFKNNTLIATPDTNWRKYKEDFANDEYYRAFKYKKFCEPGDYTIKVYNSENKGRYALAIGRQEKYSYESAWNSILTMPQVKKQFFNKPPYTAYGNYLGIIVVSIFIIFAFVVYLMFLLLKMYIGYK